MRRSNKQIIDSIVAELEGASKLGKLEADTIIAMFRGRYNYDLVLKALDIFNNKPV